MAVIQPLWKSNPVEYLVLRKFPALSWFKKPGINLSPDQRAELVGQSDLYREELFKMSESDFGSVVEAAKQDDLKRAIEAREAEERALIYNQPKADADFAYWAAASYWTLDETTALSFGKEPRVVTWKTVGPFVHISSFAKDFEARRDLVYRAGVMGQLAQQTSPSMVLAWAERMRISMPAELVDAVKAIGEQIADWKTAYDAMVVRVSELQQEISHRIADHNKTLRENSEFVEGARKTQNEFFERHKQAREKDEEHANFLRQRIDELTRQIADQSATKDAPIDQPLHAKERESLLKLIIGMAIRGYGYQPKASRGPTAKDIAGDLALHGIPLDEDTVRKYLAEARQLLPGDETEQNR